MTALRRWHCAHPTAPFGCNATGSGRYTARHQGNSVTVVVVLEPQLVAGRRTRVLILEVERDAGLNLEDELGFLRSVDDTGRSC